MSNDGAAAWCAPYGETTIEVTLPDCRTIVAEPGAVTTVDPERAADRVLADPHAPSLAERATRTTPRSS